MKYEIEFSITARMTIDVDSDEEAQLWFENFGDIDHPISLQDIDTIMAYEMEEIEGD